MNTYLSRWYEVRQELEEALPNLTDEERKRKIFDYNMFEWTYPSGIAMNALKQYNEHPVNRMQEIREDVKNGREKIADFVKKVQEEE